MVEHGLELWRWLENGAHLYVCGDASRMAKDVDDTLVTIARRHGGLSEDAAVDYRKGLVALGLPLTEKNFPLLSQSQHVQWALVREGAGIGIMVSEVGDAEPSVRRVLKDLPPITVPMWLVTHQDVRTSRRVRLVAELLAETLGQPGSARAKG